MQQIKRVWNNQDLANKVILVTGIIMAIVCLVMGQGMYGVVFIVLMLAFVAAHSTQRGKRLRAGIHRVREGPTGQVRRPPCVPVVPLLADQ